MPSRGIVIHVITESALYSQVQNVGSSKQKPNLVRLAPSTGEPISNNPDGLADFRKRVARQNIEFSASSECNAENTKIVVQLYRFGFDAIAAQNHFADTHNSRSMISDLANWQPKVESYLAANRYKLPDTSVFSLANSPNSASGFHKEGSRAWGVMDAKRKALEAIQHEVEARRCDKIGKAAVAECEENSSCVLGK